MRIIETKVYTFDELSDEAKEKAIQNLWDINVDHEWWEAVDYDAEQIGCKIKAFDIDRGSYCELECSDPLETAHKIENGHGPTCDTYIAAQGFLTVRDKAVNDAPRDENGDIDEWELDSILDEIESEFVRDLSECYLEMLRREYEYLTSEEAIRETIEANGYEFTEDGELI